MEEGEGVGEGLGSSLLLRLRSSEGMVLDRGIVQWVHKVRRGHRINNTVAWHEFCYEAFMKFFFFCYCSSACLQSFAPFKMCFEIIEALTQQFDILSCHRVLDSLVQTKYTTTTKSDTDGK